MGKRWKEEKAKRKMAVIRTVSDEWLHNHDEQVARQAIERYKAEMDKQIKAEWDRRAEEFATDDMNANFQNALAYMFAIPCRVLIERFGWKPIREDRRETRIERFATLMIEEMNRITDTEQKDIRTYARETFDLYGLKFVSDFVFTEGNDDNVHSEES